MEFDEYDYLEKTVENPEQPKEKETANGGGDEDVVKSSERERKSSRRRSDDNDEDLDSRSKRARSRDDTRDRDHDRHRERSSSRRPRFSPDHRSRDSERSDRDRHRSSRDRDREERNGGGRERERDRDRSDRDKERERVRGERERESEREKDRDKDRERERARRSRSRSERHLSDREKDVEREKSRDREKSREREFRERDLREREREGRRYREKKEEAPEPEADPERDQRTVFAYQICLKADERDVYEFFSRAGKVRDVRLIMDRNSRRSKGVGYIEFYDAMSVPMAIALSGQPLLGQAVMVKPSEAEKNLVQSTAAVAGGALGPYSGGARRLYVGNLHFNITEDQLRQVFEPFGAVELVQLPIDQDSGQCKGFGFVQFARLDDARAAQSLNGQLEIAGRVIKVSAVSDQVGMQDVGVNAGDFDDDEGGGLGLNARSRAMLMQKLDRSGAASGITSSIGTPIVNGPGLPVGKLPVLGAAPIMPLISPLGPAMPAIAGLQGAGLPIPAVPASLLDAPGPPSECLLLKNMFDPSSETEPEFDLDIKEDVQDECSKFGAVKHIYVDKNSAGFVYLRFDNTESAMKAQRSLHGRWFAGKMITATYMVPQNYEAKFPESK